MDYGISIGSSVSFAMAVLDDEFIPQILIFKFETVLDKSKACLVTLG